MEHTYTLAWSTQKRRYNASASPRTVISSLPLALRWRVRMNIIKRMPSFTFYFLRYANFGQRTDCCYNVAPSSACSKSKQSGVYTALSARTARVKTAVCDGSFSRARFHATADRYRCFFSGWPHNYAWITCFSARKSLKQRIGTPTHTVLYPTEVFFASWAKRMHSFVGGV